MLEPVKEAPPRSTEAGATRALADFVHRLTFEDLPAALIEDLSLHALDTAGVCLASTALPYAQAVAGLLRKAPQGIATAFARPGGYPARWAGFYNACLGHGTDFDDSHLEAISHPSATIFPPLLALAQEQGRDGRSLLTALAAGIEVMCRIGVVAGAALLRRGVHPTSGCGAFGAAAAIAKLEGLSVDQIVSALGFAGGMSGGLHQSTIDGSWNKCIHSGLAAQAGFAAAAYVQSGLEGPQDILERKGGFLDAFAGVPPSAQGALDDALGQRWEAARLAYKVYPCCQGVHPYADCALDLRSEVEGILDLIDRIDVRIGSLVGLRLCEPAALKANPPTPYAAKFSIPYAVSAALVRGALGPDSFTPEALAEPAVIGLARRVAYVVDEVYDEGMALRGRVEIVLADGRRFARETAASRGTPQNPWPAAEVLSKFHRNAEPVIGRDRTEAAIDAMTKLAQAAEVDSIARLFGAGADQ